MSNFALLKRFKEGVELPKQHTKLDTGYDVRANSIHKKEWEDGKYEMQPNETTMFMTDIGLQFEHPVLVEEDGVQIIIDTQVRIRSSMALDGLTILNDPATIDPEYAGNIGIILKNTNSEPYTIKKGQRIAQLVFGMAIQPEFKQVDEFDNDRGGGFGSSNKKEEE